jgi:hypothetical protein
MIPATRSERVALRAGDAFHLVQRFSHFIVRFSHTLLVIAVISAAGDLSKFGTFSTSPLMTSTFLLGRLVTIAITGIICTATIRRVATSKAFLLSSSDQSINHVFRQ